MKDDIFRSFVLPDQLTKTQLLLGWIFFMLIDKSSVLRFSDFHWSCIEMIYKHMAFAFYRILLFNIHLISSLFISSFWPLTPIPVWGPYSRGMWLWERSSWPGPSPLALKLRCRREKITSSPVVAHWGICRSGPLFGGLTGAASCWNAPQAVASTSSKTEAGANLKLCDY